MSVDEMEFSTDAEDALVDLEDRPPPPPELLAFLAKHDGFEEEHFWIPGYGWDIPGPDGGVGESAWRVVPAAEPRAQREGEAVRDSCADGTAVADLERAKGHLEVACNAAGVGQVESLDGGAGEDVPGEPVMDELGEPGVLAVSSDPYDLPVLSEVEEGEAGVEEAGAAELGGGESVASDAAAGAACCATTNPSTQSQRGPSVVNKPNVPQIEIIISDDEDDSSSVPKLHTPAPASQGRAVPAVAGQGTRQRPGALRTTVAATGRAPQSQPAPPPKPTTLLAPPRPAAGRPERADSGPPDAKRPRLTVADGGPGAPSGHGTPSAAAPCPLPPSPRRQPTEPPGGRSVAGAGTMPAGVKDINAVFTQLRPRRNHDRIPDLRKPARNEVLVEAKAPPSRSRCLATTPQPPVPPAQALPTKHRTSSSHQWTPPPAATSTAVGEGACPPKPQPTSNANTAVEGSPILPQRHAVPRPPAPPNLAQHQDPSKHKAVPDQVQGLEFRLLHRDPVFGQGQSLKDTVRPVPNAKAQFAPKAAAFRCDDEFQSAVDHNGVASSSIHNSTSNISSTTSTQAKEGGTPSSAPPGCPPKAVPATSAPGAPANSKPAPAQRFRIQFRPKLLAGGKGRAKLCSHSGSHMVRQKEGIGAPPVVAGSASSPSGGGTCAVIPPWRRPAAAARVTGRIRPSYLPMGGKQKLDGPRPLSGPPPRGVLESAGDSGGKGRRFLGSIRREVAPRNMKAASGTGRPRPSPGTQGHLEAGPSKAGPATASVARGGGRAVASASRGGPRQGTKAHCTDGGSPHADNEGRPFDLQHVVVNFLNVGSTYGEKVLKRKEAGLPLFNYEGVRLCVRHLTEHCGLRVIGVIYENYREITVSGKENRQVPADISEMCESIELTPRLAGDHHKSADDEMTIKCAYHRNCCFLDNDNYKDWCGNLRDEHVRMWLKHCQRYLQMRYYFDSGLGTFETLDGNVGALRPESGRAYLKRQTMGQ